MSEQEQRVDGFVPWHPWVGAMIDNAGSTWDQCWRKWLGPDWRERLDKAARLENSTEIGEATQYNGWRIRPVKLVFLDEPPTEGEA